MFTARSRRLGRPTEEVEPESQRLASPAQVSVSPAADACEHCRNVRIGRLFDRVAFDRGAVFPFVFVPFVVGSHAGVERNQTGVDSRLNVSAMILEFALG